VRSLDPPPPSSAEDKEGVALYLYSPFGPSWPVARWALHAMKTCGSGGVAPHILTSVLYGVEQLPVSLIYLVFGGWNDFCANWIERIVSSRTSLFAGYRTPISRSFSFRYINSIGWSTQTVSVYVKGVQSAHQSKWLLPVGRMDRPDVLSRHCNKQTLWLCRRA
jgi:hypothetical protein